MGGDMPGRLFTNAKHMRLGRAILPILLVLSVVFLQGMALDSVFAEDCASAPTPEGEAPGSGRRSPGSVIPVPQPVPEGTPTPGPTPPVVVVVNPPGPLNPAEQPYGSTVVQSDEPINQVPEAGPVDSDTSGTPDTTTSTPAGGSGLVIWVEIKSGDTKIVTGGSEVPVKKAYRGSVKVPMGTQKDDAKGGDPVNLSCGELVHTEFDIIIKELLVSRVYRSMGCFEGRMGYNWFPSYYTRLLEMSDGEIIFLDINGHFSPYAKDSETGAYGTNAANMHFLMDVAGGGWIIRTKYGKEYQYDENGLLIIIRTQGRTLHFDYLRDASNVLIKTPIKREVTINDGSGPVTLLKTVALDYQLTRIHDFAGRYLDFSYDTETGRLTAITDYTGRIWAYEVDLKGNLLSVTNPGGGKRSYTYYNYSEADKVHLDRNLKTVTDEMNQVELTVFYDKFDKVIKQIEYSSTWVYDYDDFTTTVTCPRGYDLVYDFTPSDPSAPRMTAPRKITTKCVGLRPSDPPEYVREIERNPDIHVTKVRLPNGSVHKDTLDDWGNVIESRKKPDDGPDNNLTDIVVLSEYEYRYHHVKKMISPLGHVRLLIYDYMEDEVRFNQDFDGDGNIQNVDHNLDGTTSQDFGNLIKMIGQVVTVYNPGGAPFQRQGFVLLRYNGRGDIVETEDALGTVSRTEYYTSADMLGGVSLDGFVKSVTSDYGGLNRTTTFTLDALGRVVLVTDPLGNTFQTWHDDNDNVIRTKTCAIHYEEDDGTEALLNDGYERTYDYDKAGHLVCEKIEDDALGGWAEARRIYDNAGNLIEMHQKRGDRFLVTRHAYDASGKRIETTYPEGNKTRFVYDERGFIISETIAADTADASTIYRFFDANGNPTRIVDALGRETFLEYDAFDRQVKTTMADGTTHEVEYDKEGNVVHELTTGVNALDGTIGTIQESWNTYDELGYLVMTQRLLNDPIDSSKNGLIVNRVVYDEVGRIVTIEDAKGNIETIVPDTLGYPISKTDASGNISQFIYDARGKKIEEISKEKRPDGSVRTTSVKFYYDEVGRLFKMEDALGKAIRLKMSSRDRIIRTCDTEGNITTKEYDSFTMPVKETRYLALPGGGTEEVTKEFEYDDNYRIRKLTDDNGNATFYDYDERGLLVRERFGYGSADETERRYFYDSVGDMVRKIDQAGEETLYTFDLMSRLLKAEYGDGREETYTYDGVGRILRAQTNDGSTVDHVFDTLGRMRQEIQDGRVIESEYDSNSARTRLLYADGTDLSYTRDSLNRISEIWMGTELLTRYKYFGINKIAEREYVPRGIFKVVDFDDRDRVVSHAHKSGGTSGSLVEGFGYGYDHMGNRIWKNYQHKGSQGERYSYDSLYRLTRVAYGCTDPSQGEAGLSKYSSYVIDGLGNRSSVDDNGSITNYSMSNPHNEYDVVGGLTQTHDDKGNLTDNSDKYFIFNTRNQLKEVRNCSDGSTVATYRYDALGRRLSKSTSSMTIAYVYDGNHVILEYATPSGETEEMQSRYILGISLDEVLVVERKSGETFHRYYYLDDALGSIIAVLDSSGSIAESYEYDVYGRLTSAKDGSGNDILDGSGRHTTNICNPYFFSGRRFEFDTGLYYLRARYYSPDTGRFISRDPKGYIDGMSLYEYAKSNPVNFTDCLGMDVDPKFKEAIEGALGLEAYVKKNFRCVAAGFRERLKTAAEHVRRASKLLNSLGDLWKQYQDICNKMNPKNEKAFKRLLKKANNTDQLIDEHGGFIEDELARAVLEYSRIMRGSKMTPPAMWEAVTDSFLKVENLTDALLLGIDILAIIPVPVVSEVLDGVGIAIELGRGNITPGDAVAIGVAASLPAVSGGFERRLTVAVAKAPAKAIKATLTAGTRTLRKAARKKMFGSKGTQFASKSLWKKIGRLDVENPAPGKRAGQMHYHDKAGNKYLFDPEKGAFKNMPKKVRKMLKKESSFSKAVEKGLRYLGEK
jgi:RHS repeat-associated protein